MKEKTVMMAAGLGEQPAVRLTEPLGTVVAQVRCTLRDHPSDRADPPLVDRTASFLPIGTEIHAVAGYLPTCRVAAVRDGLVHVYLAHQEVNGRSQANDCASPGSSP